jgi:hypothetical protein
MRFSLGETQFQLAPGFSKAVQFLAFPTVLLSPHLLWAISAPGRGEMFPACGWPPVLFRWGTYSSPALLDYVIPFQTVLCSSGWFADSLDWKWVSCRATQAGSRQRLCVHLSLAGPDLPRCLLLCLCGSLCCVFVGEVVETLRQRESCTGLAVRGLCLLVLWWVQFLPDACKSLSVVLCVVF